MVVVASCCILTTQTSYLARSFKNILFICKTEFQREGEKEREREKERNEEGRKKDRFPTQWLTHQMTATAGLGQAKAKSLIQFSHVVSGIPRT